MWYRNCSHENQPSFVLKGLTGSTNPLEFYRRFEFVRNYSSESYDLLIKNITDLDEGLYYCGTEQLKLVDEKCITTTNIYTHGNVTTRILVSKYSGLNGLCD